MSDKFALDFREFRELLWTSIVLTIYSTQQISHYDYIHITGYFTEPNQKHNSWSFVKHKWLCRFKMLLLSFIEFKKIVPKFNNTSPKFIKTYPTTWIPTCWSLLNRKKLKQHTNRTRIFWREKCTLKTKTKTKNCLICLWTKIVKMLIFSDFSITN